MSNSSTATTWADEEREIVLQNFTKTPSQMLIDHPELNRFTNQQISNQKWSLTRFV